MAYENIQYDVRDQIATITLNRPHALNTFNWDMFKELHAALDTIERDDAVRVLIITGAPRPDGRPLFSAGVDVKARAEGKGTPTEYSRAWVNWLDEFRKPSIAVVDGICTTGGLEVILACDFRFVAETARISDWHLKNLGLGIGGWGSATRLARLVGVANAKDILLSGREIDGHEAYRMGLANRVYPSERLMEEARKYAALLAEKSPLGMATTLAFLDQATEMQKHQALRYADLIRELTGATADTNRANEMLKAKKATP